MDSIKLLEENMVTYKNLISVACKENRDLFISVDRNIIPCMYKSNGVDMKKLFKNNMYIRKTVYEMLKRANKNIKRIDPNLSLLLTYGYRSLDVQEKRFNEIMSKLKPLYSENASLYEQVHRYIANPKVAGHPTGGAIDITIMNKETGKELDFGSKQYDYSSKKCYVHYPDITKQNKNNRFLLRGVMMDTGFAPFDGEWWHFSYGDREWAYYYKKDSAIYSQVSTKDICKFMIE